MNADNLALKYGESLYLRQTKDAILNSDLLPFSSFLICVYQRLSAAKF